MTATADHFESSADLAADAAVLFDHLDDFTRLGSHMTRSSWMMDGASMHYEFDAAQGRALGSRVRMVGRMLGMSLEVEEQVIERTPGVSKSWQTIGQPRLLILEAYRMGFTLSPVFDGCRLSVFIEYSLPRAGLGRWLGRVASGPYARWCVTRMIAEAVRRFGIVG